MSEIVAIETSRRYMGTEFVFHLCGSDREYLREVADSAFEEVERLEAQLSHYRSDSDICDLNLWAQYRPVKLEPELYRLLRDAARWTEETEGAFDCAIGALIRCWSVRRGEGSVPDAAALAEARACSGSHHLRFDDAAHTVAFAREGVAIHLGALGKGVAIDAAARRLRECGIDSALIHAGTSSVFALGVPPGAAAWEVGIRNPDEPELRCATLALRDEALSTSGDEEQHFIWEGVRYGHLLDPRSGWPARGVRSLSVVASTAAVAEVLSTAGYILGPAALGRVMLGFTDRAEATGAFLVPDELVTGDGSPVRFGRITETA